MIVAMMQKANFIPLGSSTDVSSYSRAHSFCLSLLGVWRLCTPFIFIYTVALRRAIVLTVNANHIITYGVHRMRAQTCDEFFLVHCSVTSERLGVLTMYFLCTPKVSPCLLGVRRWIVE